MFQPTDLFAEFRDPGSQFVIRADLRPQRFDSVCGLRQQPVRPVVPLVEAGYQPQTAYDVFERPAHFWFRKFSRTASSASLADTSRT